MKKWVIYIVIVFILALTVYAYSKNKGLEWVGNNADWGNGQIEDNSLALLSLKSNNNNVGNGYDIMLQRIDSGGCYPNGNCNVKDTALAALALKPFNYDIKPLLDWLDSVLTRASVTNWYIQIKADKAGNCSITYDTNQVKKVFINGTKKIKIDNKEIDWIDVERDLQANLDQPIEQIKVDCTQVNDPSIIISLLRIVQGTDFYIIQETQSSIANLVINNACYPSSLGGECNEESSFYAAYALKKLNQDVKIIPYLLDKVDNNLENAMLYTITNDQKYSDNLINTQNPLGYWDNEDIYVTSFAINALKNTKYKDQMGNATEWLKSKQITNDLANEGSFGSVRDTGAALYLALTDVSAQPGIPGGQICGNNVKELGEQCDDGNLVSGDGCSLTCQNELNQTISGCSSDLNCNVNEFCDTFTKQCKLRSLDKCGDGFCGSTEDSSNCPLDCELSGGTPSEETPPEAPTEEKSNVWLWIIIIVIVLGLGIGGYFGYKKFFGNKGLGPKRPPYFPEEQSRKEIKENYVPRQRFSKRTNIDENLEHELDKSIKETEKLLRK
ncbi:MAG: hypothetical protein AABW45_03100 [Nanoarchaeota archaeon]